MATSAATDSATLIRRILFFVFLIALTLLNLVGSFRGLTSELGIEQAQMGREVARGNVLGTKMVRPLAYAMAEEAADREEDVFFAKHKNTYHAPLHPLLLGALLKVSGGADFDKWKMGANQVIYGLDYIIAASATVCFLLSIGVIYLLICRVFDAKLAGVTALLMLLCNLFWNFTGTGLPQMLMLLLFSAALYFAFTAVENEAESKSPLVPAGIAGVFFVLLALSHWLALWILIGYIVYCSVFMRPRGVVGVVTAIIAVISCLYFVAHNVTHSGSILGSAYMTIYNNLAFGSEDMAMRTYDLTGSPLDMQRLIFRILNSFLLQITDIFKLLGAVIAAPLFFLSLLHQFKRPSIANFRWLVLILWAFAAIGMAIYGVDSAGTDSNQLHLLFIPIMSAYGLAFLSIVWARVEAVGRQPFLKNVHLVVVVAISAGPLLLGLPQDIKNVLFSSGGKSSVWPPYNPSALNRTLTAVPDDQIIVSDQPWATAWYADRMSIWLPRTIDDFDALEAKAEDQGTAFAGFLISPTSHSLNDFGTINYKYGDFAALVMDGPIAAATRSQPLSLFAFQRDLQPVVQRYPERLPLYSNFLVFYGRQRLTSP